MSDEKRQLPAKPVKLKMSHKALEALRAGNVNALIRALDTDDNTSLLMRLAKLAIEIRRESVAVIGTHEAFVRHTKDGSLHQVIRPVKLSIAEGTIYKIPKWTKRENGSWGEVWPEEAMVTFPGLVRQNAVAGCAVGQPPTVVVDGEQKTNPYVQRAPAPGGRLGDIVRVVIAVTVVGPAPATGNPVVVNYTLDYDPSKDLLHMLSKVSGDAPQECYLLDEVEYAEKKEVGDVPAGWKYVPLFGGVGYFFNLRIKDVRKVYKDYVGIAQNAVKKAQTVARRNAMRSHPAFVHQVVPDENGIAIIPVVGWAGDASTMDRWQGIQDRLARGQSLNIDDAEVIDVESEYEVVDEKPVEAQAAEESPQIDPELAERNKIISQIDEGIGLLSPSEITSLEYDPDKLNADELKTVLAKLNAIVDAKGA